MNIWENLDLNDLDGEVWKDVQGWEGMYQVSSLGRFKSLSRKLVFYRKGGRFSKDFIMKQNYSRGYLSILFYKNTESYKRFPSHVVVANAFLPNEFNKPTVNHKNGIKKDNRVSNLEWASMSEQIIHAIEIGLRNSCIGERCNFSKLSKNQVLEIRHLNKNHGLGAIELAKRYNTAVSNVRYIINRVTWKHI